MIKNNWVIFDLDGTLADIEIRRKMATKSNGKMDWEVFFADRLIELDEPNHPVIKIAKLLWEDSKHNIAIFSGRSESTSEVTRKWLHKHGIHYNVLKMRPTDNKHKFMPDEKLKLQWLNEMYWKDNVVAVFDDRDKVVKMWREIGLTCMQVAPGNF